MVEKKASESRNNARSQAILKPFLVLMSMKSVFAADWVSGFVDMNFTDLYDLEQYGYGNNRRPSLMVDLSLIHGAAAQGAVCLDGSVPAYHLDRGFGSGVNSWLIQLEGGGWCNTIRNCMYRKNTRHGSSNYMEKRLPFTGLLSNQAHENPDFFNWNRVKIRYCDGASFTGDSQTASPQLYFRGRRIFSAAMQELMSKGMRYSNQALLSGCSAGAVASVVHCDNFRNLFPGSTRVKCLSDGGMFLDAINVSGGRTLRSMFRGVVGLQGAKGSLPWSCTNRLNPTLCFFPQHLISNIKTPLFLLNAAYDSWQIIPNHSFTYKVGQVVSHLVVGPTVPKPIQASLAPPSADPHGYWSECRKNYARCSASQMNFLQGFRSQILASVRPFSSSNKNGHFINSCFAHCQTERQDTWFAPNSPRVGNKGIAESVGNWFFDRAGIKVIDCPFPCDGTCHNLVFH